MKQVVIGKNVTAFSQEGCHRPEGVLGYSVQEPLAATVLIKGTWLEQFFGQESIWHIDVHVHTDLE